MIIQFLKLLVLEIKPLGPRFQRRKATEIQIVEGEFNQSILQIISQIEPTKTTLTLKLKDKLIGMAHAEYEPKKRCTTLFDTFVAEEYRRRGFASLMVHLLFREQLLYTATENFEIRMVMKATGAKEVIENIGMGLIALKLGFEPNINYQELFSPSNLDKLEIIPANGINPYGYKLSLSVSPWTVVLVLLDPLTKRPVKDLNDYEHFIRPEDIRELVKGNQAVLGNVDYRLNQNRVEQCVAYIAENQEEFREFLKKLKR